MKIDHTGAAAESCVAVGIPTFRRPARVEGLVRALLEMPGGPAEIVVGDNSEDGATEAALTPIQDTRLRYFHNKTNLGPGGNIWQVLQRSTLPYVLFCSDEDMVNQQEFGRLERVLAQVPPVAVVLGSIRDYPGDAFRYTRSERRAKGSAALARVAFRHGHFASVALNRSVALRFDCKAAVEAVAPRYAAHYPLEALLEQCATLGDVLITPDELSTFGRPEEFSEYRASSQRFDSLDGRYAHFADRLSLIRLWGFRPLVTVRLLSRAMIAFDRFVSRLPEESHSAAGRARTSCRAQLRAAFPVLGRLARAAADGRRLLQRLRAGA